MLDSIIVGFAQLPVVALFYGLVLTIGSLSSVDPSTCTSWMRTSRGYVGTGCSTGSETLLYVIFGAYVIAQLWIWWRLVPSRMARRGSSVGMGIARLRIDDATSGGHIGRLQALWRALLATFLPTVIVTPLFLIAAALVGDRGDASDRAANLGAGVAFALGVAAMAGYALPWLWWFWDRRHQTLYDKFSRSVVHGPDGPLEPWSVVALVCGLLVVTAPLALVFGHLAMRRHDDVLTTYQGRGAARAGQVLGALVTAAIAVIVVVAIVASITEGS